MGDRNKKKVKRDYDKATSRNTSLYSTLNLTNHSLKPKKPREKSLEARNEMLDKMRCVERTYSRKGFYSRGKAWLAGQGSGRATNNFLHFGRALDRSKWRCGGGWWHVILSYFIDQR
jgi:hypothetical protein